MSAPLTSERPPRTEVPEQAVQRAGAGPTLPTWAVLASLVLALVAALAFFITGSPDRSVRTATAPPSSGEAAADIGPSGVPERVAGEDLPGKRDGGDGGRTRTTRTATVDVYNGSGLAGVAASTGAEARAIGWTVGIQDNWYGTIPKSTVYYPAALADEAKLLAQDLGIDRTRPAVSPMSFERLTVILTE